jgi:hypothetical protein
LRNVNTAKPPFAVVVCGLAACSVYEGIVAPDGGSSVTTVDMTSAGSSVATSGGGSDTAGTGGSDGTAGVTGPVTTGGAAGSATGGASGTTTSGGAAGTSEIDGGSDSAGGGAGAAAGAAGTAGNGASGGAAGSAGIGGSAGSGGTGGTRSVDAGSDAGPLGICNYANPIILLYRWWPIEAGASRLDYSFKLVNGSTQMISLSAVTARYYLTNEIASPSAVVAYGDVCCADKDITTHVTATVHQLSPAATGADTYIEIGFDAAAGVLAPAHTVEVEVEFANAVGTASNPSNDYSYIAAATGTQAQWDNCPATGNCTPFHSCAMTVYQSGALIWGNPPK